MKKRKLLSLLLALAMSVTMAAPAWAAQTYRDVPPSHWAYEAVEEMSQRGIFNGVGVRVPCADGRYKLYREGEFYGIARVENGIARAEKKLC